MSYVLDRVELALAVVGALMFTAIVVSGLVTGRLYFGRRKSINFCERPGAFVCWLFLTVWVVFLSVQEAVGFVHHFYKP